MVALLSRRQLFLIAASFSIVLLFVIASSSYGLSLQKFRSFGRRTDQRGDIRYRFVNGRKLLEQGGSGTETVNGEECSRDDIVLNQAATTPMPNGIPTYTVNIVNECMAGASCRIGNIHLSCGLFSSARLVDPPVFRRLSPDDCLVNDGRPIEAGQSVSFQYANTFSYRLSVSSADCIP